MPNNLSTTFFFSIFKKEPCYDSILIREINRFKEALELYLKDNPTDIQINFKQEEDVMAEISTRKNRTFRTFFLK